MINIYKSQPRLLEMVEDLDKNGIFIIEDYIDTNSLLPLLCIYEKLLKREFGEQDFLKYESLSPGVMIIMQRLKASKDFKLINKVFSSNWMNDLSEKFWNSKVKLNSDIYIGNDLPGTKHVAQDLHFDVKPTLKFFLYLNDVNEENGAFTCVPKSHIITKSIRQTNSRSISYENRNFTREHKFSSSDEVPVCGKAGTLIVFSTEVFHKAGIVIKNERKIMRGHTRPKEVNRFISKIYSYLGQK